MEMHWWNKMVRPMRNAWGRVSRRIRLRKNGLVKLQNDVRTCEYEDVHILWDMLKRNEIDLARSRKGRLWKFQWAKCSPLLCRGF